MKIVFSKLIQDFEHIFDTDIEEGLRKARKEKQLKLTMKIVTYLM